MVGERVHTTWSVVVPNVKVPPTVVAGRPDTTTAMEQKASVGRPYGASGLLIGV